MSCSCSGASATPWQPGQQYQPTAYPGAVYAQPYSSPYFGASDPAAAQTIQGLVAQLGMLVQALQGVIATMAGSSPVPSAYPGQQQLSETTGVIYPDDSSYPSYTPSYPQQETPPRSAPSLPPADNTPPPPPGPDPSSSPTPPPSQAPAPTQGNGGRPLRPMGELAPNAWRDPHSLSDSERNAVCGPVAAIAFARFLGRDLSIDEAANVARSVGWDTSGMKGPKSEVALLDKLGIRTTMEDKVDWEHVKREVQAGRPVIIDTPEHYYVAEGFNPQTGEFNFAQTAAIKGDHGGKTWLKPEELSLAGGARSAIYLA